METAPGFYGKFPELGDFINRRLPKAFIDMWDEWLQSSIAASREQLGDAWLDLYLTSPIWRFMLSKDLCGEHPWAGLVMPSVDKVGRYFPLTLACRLPIDANLMEVATRSSGWFEMGEQIILSALGAGSANPAGFNIEEFDAQVVSLGTLDNVAEVSGVKTDAGFGAAWQIPMPSNDINTDIHRLTHQLLLQRLGDYSFWWGSGSHQVEPSMLLCAGMPRPGDFAALLSGNWNSGSWEQWPTVGIEG